MAETRDYPAVRKTPVRLRDQDKWEVAKYCIEHKGVSQDKDRKFTNFRVPQSKLAAEVNQEYPGLGGISGYHITESINFYNLVCEITNNLPEVPIQSSVQEEMLKVEIERLKNELAKSQAELLKAATIINSHKDRFSQIRKLATT